MTNLYEEQIAWQVKEQKRADALKRNALLLVRQHKQTCPGESCAISLAQIGELVRRAGLTLTSDEWREFL